MLVLISLHAFVKIATYANIFINNKFIKIYKK